MKCSTITSAGQQLFCCAGLSNLGWWQALAGACGWQLHRAALNVFLFVQRESRHRRLTRVTQALPLEDAI